MPTIQANLWSSGDAYQRYMGRWSQRIAPRFAAWVGGPPQARWIDVGCGTGVLTRAVLGAAAPSHILGIDSAPAFLAAAEETTADPRAAFRAGDAQAIPEADDGFDVAVSGLVLNFVPDKAAMLSEMARVTRPGGIVALYVWDYAGHMQILRSFFDAATTLDPAARAFDDGAVTPVCRPGPLTALLAATGLTAVEHRAIDVTAAFASFDDYWMPFLGGTGSAPRYCASLGEAQRDALREALRSRLPTGPDGEILLAVRAWAAKGRVRG